MKWQVPNSPEMNMLDLGAWMSIQSLVETKHRSLVMRNDVLADTVEEAFNELSSDVLGRVHNRWLKVLDLIIAKGGENTNIDKFRGKKEIRLPLINELAFDSTNSTEQDQEDTNSVASTEEEDDEHEDMDVDRDEPIVEDD